MIVLVTETFAGKVEYKKENVDSFSQALCVLVYGTFQFKVDENAFLFFRGEDGEVECEHREKGVFFKILTGKKVEKVFNRLLKKDREVA